MTLKNRIYKRNGGYSVLLLVTAFIVMLLALSAISINYVNEHSAETQVKLDHEQVVTLLDSSYKNAIEDIQASIKLIIDNNKAGPAIWTSFRSNYIAATTPAQIQALTPAGVDYNFVEINDRNGFASAALPLRGGEGTYRLSITCLHNCPNDVRSSWADPDADLLLHTLSKKLVVQIEITSGEVKIRRTTTVDLGKLVINNPFTGGTIPTGTSGLVGYFAYATNPTINLPGQGIQGTDKFWSSFGELNSAPQPSLSGQSYAGQIWNSSCKCNDTSFSPRCDLPKLWTRIWI